MLSAVIVGVNASRVPVGLMWLTEGRVHSYGAELGRFTAVSASVTAEARSHVNITYMKVKRLNSKTCGQT